MVLPFFAEHTAVGRPAARPYFLRANSALSDEEVATEAHLRQHVPDQYAQYLALQAQADVSWRLSSASDAAIAAIAKVRMRPRSPAAHLLLLHRSIFSSGIASVLCATWGTVSVYCRSCCEALLRVSRLPVRVSACC